MSMVSVSLVAIPLHLRLENVVQSTRPCPVSETRRQSEADSYNFDNSEKPVAKTVFQWSPHFVSCLVSRLGSLIRFLIDS